MYTPDYNAGQLAKTNSLAPAAGLVVIYRRTAERYMITHCADRLCALVKLDDGPMATQGHPTTSYYVIEDYCDVVEPTDDDLVAMAKIALLKGTDA